MPEFNLKTLWLRIQARSFTDLLFCSFYSLAIVLKALLSIVSHPFITFLIYGIQLLYGALLGAQLSSQLADIPAGAGVLQWPVLFWQGMPDAMRTYTWGIFIISFTKSGLDFLDGYLNSRQRQKDDERRRKIPAENWFSNEFVNEIQEAIELRVGLTNSGMEPAKDVLLKCIKKIRELSASFDNSPLDSYGVNLMVAIRREDAVNEVAKQWQHCGIFFDGANPESACAQIDGILTPVASCNNEHTAFYMAGGQQPKRPLLLPVVDENDTSHAKTRQRVPGAPKAFSSRCPQYHPDLLFDVETWIYKEQKRYFLPAQADSLYQYYVKDGSARSLLSIPVFATYDVMRDGQLDNQYPVSTIVNIYSRNKNMLRSNPDIFINLIKPILSTLALALYEWQLSLELQLSRQVEKSEDEC